MANKNETYKHWNGKNLDGASFVGDKDLIKDVKRDSKTAQKYEVSNDTISADDLQRGVHYPDKK